MGAPRIRRRLSTVFDQLESREVMNASPVGPAGLMPPNVSLDLGGLYRSFIGNNGQVSPQQVPTLRVVYNYVGINVRAQGDPNAEASALRSLGMNVINVDPARNLVAGYVPIQALPTAAVLPGTSSIVPDYIPRPFALGPTGSPTSNVSGDLSQLYQVFTAGSAQVDAGRFPNLRIVAGYVGIDIKAQGGLAPELVSLQNLGMNVTSVDVTHNLVEGYLPIQQLATAAYLPGTSSIVPNYIPRLLGPAPPGSLTPNVTADLNSVYQAFVSEGGNADPSQFPNLRIVAGYIGINVKAQGDLGNEITVLRNLGMNVTGVDAAHNLVEGYLPIQALPSAAQLPGTTAIVPNYIPRLL